jgi:hypothetical protein
VNFTRVAVLAAEGDSDKLFGGGQFWANGVDAGAEKAPGGLGGGSREQALGDEPGWKWAAIFRGTALWQACELWWLALRTCEKTLGTRL